MYRPKKKDGVVQNMDVDLERTTSNDIIHIGEMDVLIKDGEKGPIIIGDRVETSIQRSLLPMIMRLVAVR